MASGKTAALRRRNAGDGVPYGFTKMSDRIRRERPPCRSSRCRMASGNSCLPHRGRGTTKWWWGCRTAGTPGTAFPTILGKCANKFVGAIQESPADAAAIAREDQQDQPPPTTVIARAVRPVAIRIPCGAKHRPPPNGGRKENGLPRRFAPRNDVLIGGWSFCFGAAVVERGAGDQ